MRRFLLVLPIVLLAAGGAQEPVPDVLGMWRGTSTCVDRAHYPACQDENVIYRVDSAAGPRGPVTMHADKLVNGVREPMGAFRLTYDSAANAWATEFTTPRFHGRWVFEVHLQLLLGRLTELPSGRLSRRVAAAKQAAVNPAPPH